MQAVARYNHRGHSWSETFVTIPNSKQGLAAVFLEPGEMPRRGSLLLCGSLLDQRKYLYQDTVKLARALATEGFAVLRFDYRGFGESPGASWETCLAHFIDDAAGCFSWIQAQQPEHAVTCMGLALGAIIAADTAIRVGATSLVACQPLWSVKTSGQRPHWVDLTPTTTVTNYAGYCISKELYAQVIAPGHRASLATTEQMNRRALILHRASGPQATEARLYAEQLTAANFDLSIQTLNAKTFWLSTDLAMPVEQIVQALCIWLAEPATTSWRSGQEGNGQLVRPAPGASSACKFLYQNDALAEATLTQAVELIETRSWLPLPTGETLALDIVTSATPPQSEQHIRRGIILLPTTGLRSGPHDIYVHFSRQLAASGLTCMRFDYSYYGDGKPTTQQRWQIHMLRAEAESATRFFCEQFALDELILLGLCTGGEFALSLSPLFPQVTACVLWSTAALHSPLTIAKRLRHTHSVALQYAGKLFYAATWRKIFTGQLNPALIYRALVKRQIAPDAEKQAALSYSEQPSVAQARPPVLLIYGEHDPDRREAERYYRRLFGKDASIVQVAHADHNFSSWQWEKTVRHQTIAWLHKHKLIIPSPEESLNDE